MAIRTRAGETKIMPKLGALTKLHVGKGEVYSGNRVYDDIV